MQDGIPYDFTIFAFGEDTRAMSRIKPLVKTSSKLTSIFLRHRLCPWFRMAFQPFLTFKFPSRKSVGRKRIGKSKGHEGTCPALIPMR